MKTSLAVETPQSKIPQWLQQLKTFPPQPVLVGVTLAAIAALVGVSLLFTPANNAMSAGGHNIVEFELAFTVQNASRILQDWKAAGQQAARESLYLDFPFILSYALALSGLTLIVTRAWNDAGVSRLAAWGLALTPAVILAALFDISENLFLLSILGQAAISPIQPLGAGICSSLKFLLLITALLYCIAGGFAWGIRRLQGHRT